MNVKFPAKSLTVTSSGLPHPHRYMDKDGKTRCPDCGAVTRDPSVLLIIDCTVPALSAPEPSPEPPTNLDWMEIDHNQTQEPDKRFVGQTWFNINESICWILKKDEVWGWYNVRTGDMREERFQLPLFDWTDYHPKVKNMGVTLTVGQTTGLGVPAAVFQADLKRNLIHTLIKDGMVRVSGLTFHEEPDLTTAEIRYALTTRARKVFTHESRGSVR